MKRRGFITTILGLVAGLFVSSRGVDRRDAWRDSDREALEKAVLGSMILDPSRVPEVLELIGPGNFREQRHGLLLLVVADQFRFKGIADIDTVADALERAHLLQEVGGREYLVDIVESVPCPDHAGLYAQALLARSA